MYRWLGFVPLVLLCARPAMGQDAGMQHDQMGDGEMQGMAMAGPHITLTPVREMRPGDQARADSIVRIARAWAEKYRDVAVAEADGFHRFAPQVKRQRIYHYTNRAAALKARFRFDPAAPTSLLYRDGPGGKLELIGVMYTAPATLSPEELDQRIPLSIARWHQHTNICLPPRDEDPVAATTGRHPEFGPRGSIATRDACEAAGGRWKDRVLNWMVHVNVFANDPSDIWKDEHGGVRHH